MIVLASQSASRRAMLDAAGVAYVALPAPVDERRLEAALAGAAPEAVAAALAEAKALAAEAAPGMLALGGDSLVEVDGQRFNKPESREDAARHLRFFSGKTMRLHSAAALARDGALVWRGAGVASLRFITMSDGFIDDYLSHEWPAVAGCVGVFRIEARGAQLFAGIDGDYFTVLGMPLLQVLGALRDLGELPQ